MSLGMSKSLRDKQRQMLLGHRLPDAAPVVNGEVWEVNGCLWRVLKIVSRDRIVLKYEGRVTGKKPVASWWRRLLRRFW